MQRELNERYQDLATRRRDRRRYPDEYYEPDEQEYYDENQYTGGRIPTGKSIKRGLSNAAHYTAENQLISKLAALTGNPATSVAASLLGLGIGRGLLGGKIEYKDNTPKGALKRQQARLYRAHNQRPPRKRKTNRELSEWQLFVKDNYQSVYPGVRRRLDAEATVYSPGQVAGQTMRELGEIYRNGGFTGDIGNLFEESEEGYYPSMAPAYGAHPPRRVKLNITRSSGSGYYRY